MTKLRSGSSASKFIAIAVLAACSSSSTAQNFPPGESYSTEALVIIDPNPCLGATNYITMSSGKRIASQITVSSTFTLDTMQAFLEKNLGGALTGFALAVYSDSSGQPGSRLAGTSTSLGSSYGGTEAQSIYGALTSQITLTASSKYWVAVEFSGSGAGYVCAAPSGSSVNFQKAGYNIGNFQYWTYSGTSWSHTCCNTWVVEINLYIPATLPTTSPTASVTPTLSWTPSLSPTPSATGTPTATGTRSPTSTPTQSQSPSATGTRTATGTRSSTATPTQSGSHSGAPTPSASASSSQVRSPGASASPSSTGGPTLSQSSSRAASPSRTASPTLTASVSRAPLSSSPTASATQARSPSVSPSCTVTASQAATPSPTKTATQSLSRGASASQTNTQVVTPTESASQDATASSTSSVSWSATKSLMPSASPSSTQPPVASSMNPSYTTSSSASPAVVTASASGSPSCTVSSTPTSSHHEGANSLRPSDANFAPQASVAGITVGVILAAAFTTALVFVAVVRATGSFCGIEGCFIPLATCCGAWPLRAKLRAKRSGACFHRKRRLMSSRNWADPKGVATVHRTAPTAELACDPTVASRALPGVAVQNPISTLSIRSLDALSIARGLDVGSSTFDSPQVYRGGGIGRNMSVQSLRTTGASV